MNTSSAAERDGSLLAIAPERPFPSPERSSLGREWLKTEGGTSSRFAAQRVMRVFDFLRVDHRSFNGIFRMFTPPYPPYDPTDTKRYRTLHFSLISYSPYFTPQFLVSLSPFRPATLSVDPQYASQLRNTHQAMACDPYLDYRQPLPPGP